MLYRESIYIHSSLEETFSFGDKLSLVPIPKDAPFDKRKALFFRNRLVKEQKYIFPIYKLYYQDYKNALSLLDEVSTSLNLCDFLCVLLQKGRDGKYFFLEDLYAKERITPATFDAIAHLLDPIYPSLSFSIYHFLKQKEREEMETFQVILNCTQLAKSVYTLDGDFFYTSMDGDLPILSSSYLSIFKKKALKPNIRESLFTIFYRMQVPFSSSDLRFFLTVSHLRKERLAAFLTSFGISMEIFEKAFSMSVCKVPKLKQVYFSFLKEAKKEEKDVLLFPTSKQIEEMNGKLLKIYQYKGKVIR